MASPPPLKRLRTDEEDEMKIRDRSRAFLMCFDKHKHELEALSDETTVPVVQGLVVHHEDGVTIGVTEDFGLARDWATKNPPLVAGTRWEEEQSFPIPGGIGEIHLRAVREWADVKIIYHKLDDVVWKLDHWNSDHDSLFELVNKLGQDLSVLCTPLSKILARPHGVQDAQKKALNKFVAAYRDLFDAFDGKVLLSGFNTPGMPYRYVPESPDWIPTSPTYSPPKMTPEEVLRDAFGSAGRYKIICEEKQQQ